MGILFCESCPRILLVNQARYLAFLKPKLFSSLNKQVCNLSSCFILDAAVKLS